MGTASEQNQVMQALNHAAGFIQSRVAARLQTRFTPVLSFRLDESVKKSVELTRLIEEAVASDRQSGQPSAQVESAPSGDQESAHAAQKPISDSL
jgi:ribosome-binding factor A